MTPTARRLDPADHTEWLRMRRALWPDADAAELSAELAEYAGSRTDRAVFVCDRPDGGGLCGFLEASLREWAEGCSASPVGYVEGWYVEPDMRLQGVGRSLVAAAEAWARGQGCAEMASDAEIDNVLSHTAHMALGYREVERIVCFTKRLRS